VDLGPGSQYMEEIDESGFLSPQATSKQLSLAETTKIRSLERSINRLQGQGRTPKVLILELVDAATMKGYRACFLKKLQEICRKHGIKILVDEVMTGFRCGHLFSWMLYKPVGFVPDFVVVGKGMLWSGLLAVNWPEDDPDYILDLQSLHGNVTAGADDITMARSYYFIKEFMDEVMQSCRVMGAAIKATLLRLVETRHRERAADGFKATQYFAHGIGGMWYTNLEIGGEAVDTMDYKRLLPPLTKTPAEIATELVLTPYEGTQAQAALRPRSQSSNPSMPQQPQQQRTQQPPQQQPQQQQQLASEVHHASGSGAPASHNSQLGPAHYPQRSSSGSPEMSPKRPRLESSKLQHLADVCAQQYAELDPARSSTPTENDVHPHTMPPSDGEETVSVDLEMQSREGDEEEEQTEDEHGLSQEEEEIQPGDDDECGEDEDEADGEDEDEGEGDEEV
jgi:hypothetical protein